MRFGALDRLVPTGALKTQEKCLKSECQSGKIRSCHRNEKARWRPLSVLSLPVHVLCGECSFPGCHRHTKAAAVVCGGRRPANSE